MLRETGRRSAVAAALPCLPRRFGGARRSRRPRGPGLRRPGRSTAAL